MLKDSESTTYLLHNIGNLKNANYNTREEVLKAEGLLTFDGVYKNVWENRDVLEGKDVILFVMGDYVGKDNSFDTKMPLEELCDWNQIMDLVINYGCHLGWHTWSHRDITKLSYDEIRNEVTPPFPMDYFSFPYGKFNQSVYAATANAGFEYAFGAGKWGDGSRYQLKRKYL